jgi:YbgC/YbaW family acyl-CoA thioester hydrolase
MPFEFKLIRRIEFAETDMAGIVHFANFFRMMESTEHAFFRSLGASIHSHEEGTTIGWPRVSASCDYRRPLRFEEEVEIHLLVEEVRSRSIRYLFVFRKMDGTQVARGRVAAVCATVDKTTGKLVPLAIPEKIRAQISAAPPEMLASPAAETLAGQSGSSFLP